MNKSLDALRRASGINGINAEYLDQLYEAFKESPDNVSPEWRHYFYGFELASQLAGSGAAQGAAPSVTNGILSARGDSVSGVQRLLMAYRMLGHLAARVDPLEMDQPRRPVELDPAYYGLDDEALQATLSVVSIDPINPRPAGEIVDIMAKVYCGSLACEHMHITASDERRWIEQRLESTHGDWSAQLTPQVRREVLRRPDCRRGPGALSAPALRRTEAFFARRR